MQKDHRPYYLKKLTDQFENRYARHFLAPQCKHLGKDVVFRKPWYVDIYGRPVSIDDYTTVIAMSDKRVMITAWQAADGTSGKVEIGKHCLICQGVRILAATGVTIEDDCMLANNVCISDSDWHDLYDRTQPIGKTEAIRIGKNAWIGDSAMICKGVHIGDNAIVGAGSIVTKDIPANAVAGGNPACVIKYLDTDKPIKTRSQWMAEPGRTREEFDELTRRVMEGNTLLGWLRSKMFPCERD